jgi:hypothetical protein
MVGNLELKAKEATEVKVNFFSFVGTEHWSSALFCDPVAGPKKVHAKVIQGWARCVGQWAGMNENRTPGAAGPVAWNNPLGASVMGNCHYTNFVFSDLP